MSLSNQEFLQAIFGNQAPSALVSGFQDYNRPLWSSQFAGSSQTLERADFNQFYACSLFSGDRRQLSYFKGQYIFVVDDIGHGVGSKVHPSIIAGHQFSFIIETSKDNYQAGIIFTEPEPDIRKLNEVTQAYIEQVLRLKKDPGMKAVTGVFRLPVGVNNKTKYPEPFPHVLHYWNPSYKRSLKEIARDYHLTRPKEYVELDNLGHGGKRHFVAIETMQAAGLIYRPPKANGDYIAPCPNISNHTLDDDCTYYNPSRGFKCFHGGCNHINTKIYVDWLKRTYPTEWAKVVGGES